MAQLSRTTVAWSIVWVLVGSAWVFGLLGRLSIGLFILPVAAVATVLLALRPASRVRWAALVVGAGLPLCWVAYLNRSGPGTVCTTTVTSQYCVDESNPLRWLTAGLAAIAIGAILLARHRRTV